MKSSLTLSLQVAAFAATPMGAEAVLSQQLPGGTSQQHSEQLLQQTAEAREALLRCVSSMAVRFLLYLDSPGMHSSVLTSPVLHYDQR